MNGDKTLFGGDDNDECPPPSTGHPMSDASAASVSGHTARLRTAVLAFVDSRGTYGATMDECEAHFGSQRGWHSTISPRFWELSGKNRKARIKQELFETGRRRVTRRGRMASVYVTERWLEASASA